MHALFTKYGELTSGQLRREAASRDLKLTIRDLKIAVYGKRLTSRNSFVTKSKS